MNSREASVLLTTTYDVQSVVQASLAAAAAAAIIFCCHTNIGANFLHNALTLFEPQSSCGAVTSCLR